MALAFERGPSLLAPGTPAQHLGQRFAHLLDDMEMIGHDAGTWQAQLDRFAEGTTQIHADRLPLFWRSEAVQHGTHLSLRASHDHIKHPACLQIA